LTPTTNVAGSKLLIYHLESRGNDVRLLQVEQVLSDAARQDAQRPVVIAGDFNLMHPKTVRLQRLQTQDFRMRYRFLASPLCHRIACWKRGAGSIGHSFADRYAPTPVKFTIK